MQVGVVAVTEERLGVAGEDLGIQVAEDFYLVFPANAGEHGLDLRVAERRVQVLGPFGWGSLPGPGRGVLDRLQAELIPQPRQAQLERQRADGRAAPRRGEHGDAVATPRLGRVGEPANHRLLPFRQLAEVAPSPQLDRGQREREGELAVQKYRPRSRNSVKISWPLLSAS